MKGNSNDHRVRVTKMLIRKAFTDLLRQKPIQNVSVQELCTLANINRGTFYSHYKDIYDLLLQLESDMLVDFQTVLEPIINAGPDSGLQLIDVCLGIYQCFSENADVCAVMLGEHSDKTFVDKLIACGKDASMATFSRQYPKASRHRLEYFYAYVSSGSIGLLRLWLDEGMLYSARDVAVMTEQLIQSSIRFLEQEE